MDYRYVDYETILNEVNTSPEKYSEWFKKIFQEVHNHIKNEQA